MSARRLFLSETFTYLRCAAVWPLDGGGASRSRVARILHKCYTLLVFALMLLALLTMGVALALEARDVQETAKIGYLLVTATIAFVKGMNSLLHRDSVELLVDLFTEGICLTVDEGEARSCYAYDVYSRYLALVTSSIGNFTVMIMSICPLLMLDDETVALPYKAWYPFEVRSGGWIYCAIYAKQLVTLYVICWWNGSSDVLMCGFMLQICSQLQLLTHRLRLLPSKARALATEFQKSEARRYEAGAIRRCVGHHLRISRIVELVRAHFVPNVLSQLFLCTITICLNIYQLAAIGGSTRTAEFAMMIIYLNAMLFEILLYCWFGNEVTVKSSGLNQAIFQTDWTSLHVQTQKELLFVMQRAQTPFRMTCGPFVTLSTGSFTSILKFSYSMYNVLKRSL